MQQGRCGSSGRARRFRFHLSLPGAHPARLPNCRSPLANYLKHMYTIWSTPQIKEYPVNATEATVAAQEQALSAVRATQETIVTFLKPFASLAEPMFDAANGLPFADRAAHPLRRRRAVVRLCGRRPGSPESSPCPSSACFPVPLRRRLPPGRPRRPEPVVVAAATAGRAWRDVPPLVMPSLSRRRRFRVSRYR